MIIQSINPIFSLPKKSLKDDGPRLEQKKEKPVEIQRAAINQIRFNVGKNLENLRLSVMSPGSIRYTADSVARQQSRPRPKSREWTKVSSSRPRKGKEIVASVAITSKNYRRTDVNQTDKRKFWWDADMISGRWY